MYNLRVTDQRERTTEAGRTPLTRRAVAEAALALADSDGLTAVTIRRLATELGVTPMALYWHFRNKDELLDGMVDRIFDKMDPTVRTDDPWPAQLRTLLMSMVDVLNLHPSTAPLLSSRTTTSDGSLRITEALLDILRRGGFSPAEATQVARHALSTLTYLVGAAAGHMSSPAAQIPEEDSRSARIVLESLPADRYPRLVEAAGPLSECEDPERSLAFGLDLLLAGVEAMAARRR